jgi:hypothetical protein
MCVCVCVCVYVCVYIYIGIIVYHMLTWWIIFENKTVLSEFNFADWALFSCPTPTWELQTFKYRCPTQCITQRCPRIKLDFDTPGWNAVTAHLEYDSTSSWGKSGNTVTLNPLSAGWPIYYTLMLLHIMPSGNLPATTFSVFSFILIHKSLSAITLLNSVTFAHYVSWNFCILNDYPVFSTTYPHILALRELTAEVLIESGFNAHKLQESSSYSNKLNHVKFL